MTAAPLWIAAALAAVGALVYAAAGALAPFALAAVLAYMLSPLADKMESRWSPTAAAGVLVALIFAMLLALPLLLAPIVIAQISKLAAAAPELFARAGDWLGAAQPELAKQLQELEIGELARRAAGVVDAKDGAKAAAMVAGWFGQGAAAAAHFLFFLLLTPLSAFYFLRDRNIIAGELTDSLPPRWRDETLELAHDLDGVLGEFFHGQLLVMALMAALYSAMLWIAGLEYAVAIGVITGVLVFIPYVGFMLGLSLATLAALGQFESWGDFALIWILMGAATSAESFLLTPRLVGERIGLHPVLVLLSLSVMASLLGFVGALTALPLAAALLVLSRHLRRRYINSDFYGRS